MTLDLSRREIALIVVTASVALVVGIVLGLWSVPDAALDVPTDTRTGYDGRTVVDARYQPVPDWLPVIALLPAVATLWARDYVRAGQARSTSADETDNYLDHLGGDDRVDD